MTNPANPAADPGLPDATMELTLRVLGMTPDRLRQFARDIEREVMPKFPDSKTPAEVARYAQERAARLEAEALAAQTDAQLDEDMALIRFAAQNEISLDWLVTGEGLPMLDPERARRHPKRD